MDSDADPPPVPAPRGSTAAGRPEESILLSQAHAARLLDVTVRTLERWRSAGLFPGPDVQMGSNFLRWKRETVLRWIEQRSRQRP